MKRALSLLILFLAGLASSSLVFAQEPAAEAPKTPDEIAWEKILEPTQNGIASDEEALQVVPKMIENTLQFEKDFPQSEFVAEAVSLRLQSAFFLQQLKGSDDPELNAVIKEITSRQNLPATVAFHLAMRDIHNLRDQSETPASEGIEKIVEAFGKKYPGSQESARLALMTVRMYQQQGETTRTQTLLAKLAESDDPEIKRRAAAMLRRMNLLGSKPELAFKAMDGREIDLAKMEGKVVLVDFWATWCGPCIAALPEIKEVYDKYHDKGFEVIGISLDDDREKLDAFIKDQELPWPQHFDGKGWENEIGVHYGIQSIPATFLVDQSGKVVEEEVRGSLEEKVAALLKQ